MKFFYSLLILTMSTLTAKAQSYEITSVQSVGSGCPQGSVSATVSPDFKSLSILFDSFVVHASKGNNSVSLLNKKCKFTIGVRVSPGYNLEATTLQYRGFASLPQGVNATLTTTGPILQKSRFIPNANAISYKMGNMNDIFFVEHQIMQDFKNTCQQQTSIQLETTLALQGKQNRFTQIFPEESQLVLDSIDSGPSSSPIELGVQLSPCR